MSSKDFDSEKSGLSIYTQEYLNVLYKIRLGNFTKECLEELIQKWIVSDIPSEHGFILDSHYVDKIIDAIDAGRFRCFQENANNFRTFLNILKPFVNSLSRPCLNAFKHLIRDIERDLFY